MSAVFPPGPPELDSDEQTAADDWQPPAGPGPGAPPPGPDYADGLPQGLAPMFTGDEEDDPFALNAGAAPAAASRHSTGAPPTAPPVTFGPQYDGLPEIASRLAAARMPPHSDEAEQAVLGALLITTTDGFDAISEVVVEPDFYKESHRIIFRAIGSLVTENANPDIVTVAGWLDAHGLLEKASGLAYLATLADVTPSASNVKVYAEIVRERSVLRQMITVANEIADSAFDAEGRTSKELLDEAETKVFAIADQTTRTGAGFQDIKSVLRGAVERITLLYESDAAITGLETGFTDLDEKTSGLQKSDLIIVAGRPSMGKTTFAMNIAEHAAMTAEAPVAVFSMEMPAEQLALRMISSLGRVELQKIRTGKLADQDWPRINSAIAMLAQKKSVFIDDTPALTPTDVRARSRRLARERGLSLIVIDYLQLMQLTNSKENRATEISEISRSLKALAKELEVPIIALSQLNRSLEQRPDKRPVMSDLRESGAIEQDADVIMFIYRDEVYNPEDEANQGRAEILIRKQRNGPIGKVDLTFLGKFTRFENFSPEVQMGGGFV